MRRIFRVIFTTSIQHDVDADLGSFDSETDESLLARLLNIEESSSESPLKQRFSSIPTSDGHSTLSSFVAVHLFDVCSKDSFEYVLRQQKSLLELSFNREIIDAFDSTIPKDSSASANDKVKDEVEPTAIYGMVELIQSQNFPHLNNSQTYQVNSPKSEFIASLNGIIQNNDRSYETFMNMLDNGKSMEQIKANMLIHKFHDEYLSSIITLPPSPIGVKVRNVLVGNKIDLEYWRMVTTDEGFRSAQELFMEYYGNRKIVSFKEREKKSFFL
jgi:hypothetical protein